MTKTMNHDEIRFNRAAYSRSIAYIIYMVVSLYILDVQVTDDACLERSGFFYGLLNKNRQVRIGSRCIDFMEEEVLDKLPKGFLDQPISLSIKFLKKSRLYAVVFENDIGALWMTATPSREPFFAAGIFERDVAGELETGQAAIA